MGRKGSRSVGSIWRRWDNLYSISEEAIANKLNAMGKHMKDLTTPLKLSFNQLSSIQTGVAHVLEDWEQSQEKDHFYLLWVFGGSGQYFLCFGMHTNTRMDD